MGENINFNRSRLITVSPFGCCTTTSISRSHNHNSHNAQEIEKKNKSRKQKNEREITTFDIFLGTKHYYCIYAVLRALTHRKFEPNCQWHFFRCIFFKWKKLDRISSIQVRFQFSFWRKSPTKSWTVFKRRKSARIMWGYCRVWRNLKIWEKHTLSFGLQHEEIRNLSECGGISPA